ncbi:MAG: endonuclease/exonuclease/phosphatase family protein [Phycisphaerales bacterium JB060]
MKLLALLAALLAALLLALDAPGVADPGSPRGVNVPTAIGVMSFNIRYGAAGDGPNHWEHRRGAVIDLIDRRGEDFVGLQEALRFQIDEIASGVPRYAFVGVGRDDGQDAGEFCAILYDTRTWKVDGEHQGTFWLSDTPEVVASTSWGNGITRIATYARFERVGPKKDEGEPKALWVFNTHFDHRSQPSRERSAALVARRIAGRANPGEPVVLMGDFNAGETNPAIAYLRGEADVQGERTPAPLVDSFRIANPGATDVGTFGGFDPAKTGGEKIDHVFIEPGASVLDAAIVRDPVPGDDARAPSDHFPVTARLAWPSN